MPNLRVGETVFIDEQEHDFFNLVSSETGGPDDIQFRDSQTHLITLYTQAEFDELYLAGRIRWKSDLERPGDEIPEEHCHDGAIRTIRQLFTKAFDANPVLKTAATLVEFYGRVLGENGYSHDQWRRSGGTLLRWLKSRGEPGRRARKYMGDRRRRGPQASRIHPIALDILSAKAERYWNNCQVTAKDVYVDVHGELDLLNDHRVGLRLKPIQIPGRTTIWRWLTSHTDYDKTRRRFGPKEAAGLFEPVKSYVPATRILDVAIIDDTWLDCFVIDDQHHICVGRPWLTIAIDVRSRYPLGYTLSFTPPSVATVMMCLRQVVRPKLDIKRRFPEINGDWSAFGVPRTVLVDNAWALTGSSFRDACEDSSISIEWAPVRNPQYKGIVERFFRTLNQELIHKLAGAVPFRPHVLKEYGIDPAEQAILTLSQIEEFICQLVIEVYGREFHRGIKAIPEEVWRRDAKRYRVDYHPDLRALDNAFGKLGGERKLTKNGIQFKELTYRSEDVRLLLDELLPRERKRGMAKGTVTVKFKYWPEDISRIVVWNHVRNCYVNLPCTDTEYAKGLSEHHHDAIRKHAQEQGLAFSSERERCAARAHLNERVASLITNVTIGQRRRLQRLRPAIPRAIQTPPPDEQAHDQILPIQTVSARTDGDRPYRTRPRKTAGVRKRKQSGTSEPTQPLEGNPPPQGKHQITDPFASVDRAALINDPTIGEEFDVDRS